MQTSDIQTVIATTGYYKGVIDGIRGPLQRKAVEIIRKNGHYLWKGWTDKRQSIAAAQVVLNVQGYEAGVVDGLYGHNTKEAFVAFLADKLGTPKDVDRTPFVEPAGKDRYELPHQSDVRSFYGEPGDESNMDMFYLPFRMRLDWDLGTTVSRVRLHKKCGDSFIEATAEVRHFYGSFEWNRLGLDRYAGGYNPRKMRGGTSWSMHAYGCAVDIYAAPNALRTRCPEALFCEPIYTPFLDIMEKWGWLPAIRLWGADAMHFQQARL